MTESAVTDFPEPDSPTSASVSPLRMSKETRSTASASRSPRPKATERSWTERRGDVTMACSGYIDCSLCNVRLLSERLAGVEGIAHRLADEDQQRQHDGHGEKARQP